MVLLVLLIWFMMVGTFRGIKMKNKKLIKIFVLSLMSLLAFSCAFGCKAKKSYEVSLDKTQITLSAGTFVQLTATTNNLDSIVEWSSSLESVATVTSDGKVYGVNVGSATITAKYEKAKAKGLI